MLLEGKGKRKQEGLEILLKRKIIIAGFLICFERHLVAGIKEMLTFVFFWLKGNARLMSRVNMQI